MTDKRTIYAVDDEEPIRDLYACALESAGFYAECFESGDGLFDAIRKRLPDLFILDIMLDGADGYDILKRLKSDAAARDIPVIMASAKGEEISKVRGLNLGADDYIAKPFGVLELVARVNAVLRRAVRSGKNTAYKDIEIDDGAHEARAAGNVLSLTRKEYALLRVLCEHAPEVVGRDDIFTAVWGDEYMGETRTLDIHIAAIRRALKDASSAVSVSTVRGIGYKLK